MSKEIEVEIPFGDGKTPNANGRIYTQEAMDKAFEALKLGKIFLTNPVTDINPDKGVDPTQIRGVVVDAEKEGVRIKAKIEVADDIIANLLRDGCFDVVPNGTGDINPDTKTVENYELFSVSLTLDSAFGEPKPFSVDMKNVFRGPDDDIRPSESTDEE